MTEPKTGPHGGNRGSTAAKLNARQKEKLALDLRLAGATFDQIADHIINKDTGEKLYANKSNAWNAINRAIKAIPVESAVQVKDLELQRLDVALMAIWPAVRRGDTFSIDRMLAIMNRRARYLGLDEKLEDNNTADVKTALSGFMAGLVAANNERKRLLEELPDLPDTKPDDA